MTSRPGISKYFIAIIPPPPIFDQALQWKEFFKREFNSKAALHSPPHITLHMPFEWKVEKENRLLENLSTFALTQKSLDVELKGFGCFPPRVIFIQVIKSPALQDFQSALFRFCKTELNLFNANRLNTPFHPHLTLAFRDLKKADFPKAWAFVSDLDFHAQFTCRELVLFKHNGKSWQSAKTFELGKD